MIIQGTLNKDVRSRLIQLLMFIWAVVRLKRAKRINDSFSVRMDQGAEYEAVWPFVERHEYKPKAHKNYKEWYVPGNPDSMMEWIVGTKYSSMSIFNQIVNAFTGLWLTKYTSRHFYKTEVATMALRGLGYRDVKADWNNYQLQMWLDSKAKDLSSPIREIRHESEPAGWFLTFLYNTFSTLTVKKVGNKYASFMTVGPIIHAWMILWGLYKCYQVAFYEGIFWKNWPDLMFVIILGLMVLLSFTTWLRDYYHDHYPKI